MVLYFVQSYVLCVVVIQYGLRHFVPSVACFLLGYACSEAVRRGVGGEVCQCRCDGFGGDLSDITDFAVGNDLGQSAHIGDEHRFGEVVGYLRDAGLRGALVWLHNQVCQREIGADFLVRDVAGVPDDDVLQSQFAQEGVVFVLVAVELAGDNQFDPVLVYSRVCIGVHEQIKTFVVANQAEEQQVGFVRFESEFACCFLLGDGRSEVVVERMTHEHEVYEGAKMFAYVGDNTITDFTMKIEVGFLFSQSISGFIGIGFRCDNFASSSKDGDDSLIGYYLEISQYQIKLMKYQYGYNLTLGIEDLVNTIGDATEYTIKMIGNQISVYKEDRLVFSICDQFAFSSGHLGFGSKDTNGVIRNLSVSKGE